MLALAVQKYPNSVGKSGKTLNIIILVHEWNM